MKEQLRTNARVAPAYTIALVAAIATACAGGARQTPDAPATEHRPGTPVAEAPLPSGPATTAADELVVESSHGPAAGGGGSHPHPGSPAPERPRTPPPAGGHGSHASPPPSAPAPTHTILQPDGTLRIAEPAWTRLSARAREQVAQVQRAVAHLDTPAKARAGAYRPMLGTIPTMGAHWVNQARLTNPVELEKPATLMFSRIGGEDRLVGAAYAYFGTGVSDAPDLFDGNQDAWHEHPEFAPEGQSLVMLHVWFVPSPHGVFAGHNPWLAYWGAGLVPPPDAALGSQASARRVHRLAIALAEHAEPMQFAGMLELDEGTRAEIARRRSAIGALIPAIAEATRGGDRAAWNRAADEAITHWMEVRDLYIAAVPQAEQRELLVSLYGEMERGHVH